jgi:thiamine biosynthesis protein ThiI
VLKYDAIEVHFGELWLKGMNRNEFISRLKHNISDMISATGADIVLSRDRLFIYHKKEEDASEIIGALKSTFGISWFGPVLLTKNSVDSIISVSNRMFSADDTVRVSVSRSYKGTTFDSKELVGSFIHSGNLNYKLDKNSDKALYISIMASGASLCKEKIKGLGGLPVGSSGRAVVLLSGGIDSPVSALYAMKRGLKPTYLHVHAFSDNSDAENSKMNEIIRILRKFSPGSKVYFIPSHIFQTATLKIPRKYELVLFRRFLFKIAEKVAEKEDAEVIVTGESLGQVASQTVKNMIAAQNGINRLIFRPLSGFDKAEIISKAKELGTYTLSIMPYKDVCSIGVRNPSTGMLPDKVSVLYDQCDIDAVINRSLILSDVL